MYVLMYCIVPYWAPNKKDNEYVLSSLVTIGLCAAVMQAFVCKKDSAAPTPSHLKKSDGFRGGGGNVFSRFEKEILLYLYCTYFTFPMLQGTNINAQQINLQKQYTF